MCTRVVHKTELLVISDIVHGLILCIALIINFLLVVVDAHYTHNNSLNPFWITKLV